MEQQESGRRRLRYYGPTDLTSRMYIEEAAQIIRVFEGEEGVKDVVDAIELHNAQLFIAAGFVSSSLSDLERTTLERAAAHARGAVARFFTSIVESNIDAQIHDVPFEYLNDLVNLLGCNRAYERVSDQRMLATLAANGVHLRDMLSNKRLVRAYDAHLRELMLADTKSAEILIRHHFTSDSRSTIFVPTSLTPSDTRELLSRYVEHEEANYNDLGLLTTAPIGNPTGVDAKLKLQAKRRRARETDAFFKNNAGIKTGAELRITEHQDEPVISGLDGMVATFSYSREWLAQTTDNPSILNNFQHLFEFTDRDVILALPAYKADLGVFERFLKTTGRTDYHFGSAFSVRDMTTTLQTELALKFLGSHDVDLESVISWFFQEYLPTEYSAHGFTFSPSAKDSSFLEKTRHLLVEMESVVHQFRLHVEEGEIDRELLTISSDAVRYRQIPSSVEGKYLYPSEAAEIWGILNALFSDQSPMTYIREGLSETTMAELLVRNTVTYEDFADYQRPTLDQLIDLGVLGDVDRRVQFASFPHFRVLHSLWTNEAVSYLHLPSEARTLADEMVTRGWLRREATLLTSAEGSYFNFQLNKAEFSNGPELRNKYLHGSQPESDGPGGHFGAYVVALKLMIALVLKINDDFALAADSSASDPAPSAACRPREPVES